MRKITSTNVHNEGKQHKTVNFYNHNGTVIKFTHDVGNAYERFSAEIFDGKKLNNILSLCDLGETSNTSLYINSKIKVELRTLELFSKGKDIMKKILNKVV